MKISIPYTLKKLVFILIRVITYPLSAWVTKDPRIIVISSIRYNDNSKYLFEYLASKNDLNVFWLTADKKTCDYIITQGNKCIYTFIDVIKTLSRAGMVVYSGSTFPDRFGIVGNRTIKYCLDHGMGPKSSIYFGDMKKAINYLKTMSECDYFNFTSEYTKNIVGKVGYKFPNKSLVVNGYCRNDHLFEKSKMDEQLRTKPLTRKLISTFNENAKLILYTPTWRKKSIHFWPLQEISGFNRKNFDSFLLKNNIYLLYTLHPNTPAESLVYGERIVFIDYTKYPLFEINDLLPEVDVLVNDYSTTSTDFAILQRPQIFVMPDYDEYIQDDCLLEDYRKIMPGIEAYSYQEFLTLLLQCLELPEIDIEKHSKYLSKYYDTSIRDSCERHYLFIKKVQELTLCKGELDG
jgi:CDP-glycerol glycerophosphotransferase